MARLIVCDSICDVTADIEASEPLLREALEHEKAETVLRCAVLMSLSALAEGGPWPIAALQAMSDFMNRMKRGMVADRLM
jgi:hypothetical protein